jgi:phage FluMu protein Com
MKEILEDYRCTCGKLLFRGLILTGGVEVKCKYCKNIQTIDGLTGKLSTDARYLLFLDEKGHIVQASSTAKKHAGFEPIELVGMYVADLLLLLEPSFYNALWEATGNGETRVFFKRCKNTRT